MSFWYVVFVAACITLFIAPIALVFNDDYEDGVIGRAGLLGMAFFAAIFLFEVFFGNGYHIEREEAGLTASMALFLVWHIRKVCRRIKLEKALAIARAVA